MLLNLEVKKAIFAKKDIYIVSCKNFPMLSYGETIEQAFQEFSKVITKYLVNNIQKLEN